MPTLRVELSGGPLQTEHDRLLRTALRRGGDAPEPIAPIDPSPHHPAAVRVARRGWLRRMAEEHRSASVFSAMLPQLMEAEAPLDFQTVVLRMAMDELRHGALCGAVVEALGGRARIELPTLTEGVAEHVGASPRVRVARNVLYACCLSETISIALTAAEREHTTEPAIARVLDQLAGDEMLHGRFGWLYLAHVRPSLDGSELEDLRAYVPFAIDDFRERLTKRMSSSLDPAAPASDLAALGVSPPELMRDVVEDTMREVIEPSLRSAGLLG